jgi:transcription elongation factor GreB
MLEKDYITSRGFQALQEELKRLLRQERPVVVQEVSTAAALGDRSENAEYIYGKKRLREIDRRVRWLQRRLDSLTVVDPAQQSGSRVFFGATVTVEDEDGQERVFKIVGSDETDAEQGHISWRSPIGAALLGKELDDEVKAQTPAGVRTLAIVGIRYC